MTMGNRKAFGESGIAELRRALVTQMGAEAAATVLSDEIAQRLTSDPDSVAFMQVFADADYDAEAIGPMRVFLANERAEEYLAVWPELAEGDILNTQIFRTEREIEGGQAELAEAEEEVAEKKAKLGDMKVRLYMLRKAAKSIVAPTSQVVSP